jgi:predicted nucleic acid-binding protein
MLVISDTTPLTALLLTRRDVLLRQIFDRVVIPPAVQSELHRVHAALPAWIEVIAPQTRTAAPVSLRHFDSAFAAAV